MAVIAGSLLCTVAPSVTFGIYVLVAAPTPPSPVTVGSTVTVYDRLEFVGTEAAIQCDAGELTRTEAAIKVEASLRQGICGANPEKPNAPRSLRNEASNPFECVAASGLWTPTGNVTMETLQAEGFFVDMDAIASFADACSQANVRTARTVFRRLHEAFGRPTYQWICCTVHSLFGLHFRPTYTSVASTMRVRYVCLMPCVV